MPQNERDIPDSLFAEFDLAESAFVSLGTDVNLRIVSSRRPEPTAASSFLRDVRNFQSGLQRTLLRRVTTADVVAEEALPDIGTLGRALSALFAPNRPLRPQRKNRKVAATVAPEQCHVLVRVVRASDVPTRASKSHSSAAQVAATSDTLGFVRARFMRASARHRLDLPVPVQVTEAVRPFVEVVFQRQVKLAM